MEICKRGIHGGFIEHCDYRSKSGLVEQYLLNFDDIDREATQLTNKQTVISNLILKEGAKIYRFPGDKRSKASHSVKVDDFGVGYTHTDEYILTYRGTAARKTIQDLVNGARVVSIIKKVDSGVKGELTFEVVGYDSGLKLNKDDYATSDNSGTLTLGLTTEEGTENTGIKLLSLGSVKETESFIEKHLHKDDENA